MLKRLQFGPRNATDASESPFHVSKSASPLRITLHMESLRFLDEPEASAMKVLAELCTLEQLVVVSSEAGSFPYLHIGDYDEARDLRFIEVTNDKTKTKAAIVGWGQWPIILDGLLPGLSSDERSRALSELALALAHESLRGDILVTASPVLHSLSSRPVGERWNCLMPTDALAATALHLRARGHFVILREREPDFTSSLSESTYYWALAHALMPSIWRVKSAIGLWPDVEAGEHANAMVASIPERLMHSLRALDEVALQFLGPGQGADVLYHVQLAVVLLAGAFEALAQLSAVTYRLNIHRRQITFRHSAFKERFASLDTAFHRYISTQEFEGLLDLIWSPRDLVQHREGLVPMYVSKGYSRARGEPHLNFTPPDPAIIRGLEKLGESLPSWGITLLLAERGALMAVEPYTFLSKLIRRATSAIDQVLHLVKVESSVPSSGQIRNEPPDVDIWSEGTRNRLLLLSGYPPGSPRL